MKLAFRWISVLCILAATPLAASAQVGLAKHFVTLGLGGGMSMPVGDAGDAFKNGFNVQGFARLNLPHLPVAPRFDLDFSRFDLDETQIGVPGKGQLLAGLANLQIGIMPLGPVHPYVIAGLGAYHLKTNTEGTTPTSDSGTHFGINGGAGVTLHLGAVNGYVEGRVDNVFTEKGLIDTQKVQLVPVTFGLTF